MIRKPIPALRALVLSAIILPFQVRAQSAAEHITAHAQEPLFNAFAGLDLPNEIRIEGARAIDVKVTQTEGPGVIELRDSQWFWHYSPSNSFTGQLYTVSFNIEDKNSATKNLCSSSFEVNIHKLEPLSESIFSPNEFEPFEATPYTKVRSRINGKYKSLDGYYKIVVRANDEAYKTFDEPYGEFTPMRNDEGKRLYITILFRSFQSKEYVQLHSLSATIHSAPLSISAPHKIRAGEEIKIMAMSGIEGDYSIPEGSYLQVESDGYFKLKALNIRESSKKSSGMGMFEEEQSKFSLYDKMLKEQDSNGRPTFQYILKPTAKMKPSKSEYGLPIKVTFIEPVSGQRVTKTFVIQS